MIEFEPTRTAGLERLSEFIPLTGKDYTSGRNYDLGHEGHPHVSTLSPYIRHRLVTEEEVVQAVLGRFSLCTAEKFIQEVYWRTYWKGWLEMRPSVWGDYKQGVKRAMDRVQTQSGLRSEWEAACKSETGIDPFDAWAAELVETGYLHNHARMWFASIWIFTLRLPWELGADFFQRHLLDGDAASNTLSWRWVGGLQTKGKTYLARTSNIAKYTKERFRPTHQLATEAPALDGPPNPAAGEAPRGDALDPNCPTVLVLHEDDLTPSWLFERSLTPKATAFVRSEQGRSPLEVAPHVGSFVQGAMEDTANRYADRLGDVSWLEPGDLGAWAKDHGAETITMPHAPVGAAADALAPVARDIEVVKPLRPYDAEAWPYATKGFFPFKEKIPRLVGGLKGLKAA
ncbi:MAG: FAD-binding domain-containing protein [Shimia sp.]